jgi:hypothetical protein
MAYKFFYPSRGETLNKNPSFKATVDSIVASASHLTFVGWRPDTGIDHLQLIKANFQDITVIEIFKRNADVLKSTELCRVICDDVANFERHLSQKEKQVLIWQDGPEHVEMKNSVEIIKNAQKHFSNIIIATPDGIHPQDEIQDNPYERHLSSWFRSDYVDLNFIPSSLDQEGFLTGVWSKR